MTFPVTAAQFGSGDVAELVIDVDRTFVPGGSDTRELGIQVFHAFVERKVTSRLLPIQTERRRKVAPKARL